MFPSVLPVPLCLKFPSDQFQRSLLFQKSIHFFQEYVVRSELEKSHVCQLQVSGVSPTSQFHVSFLISFDWSLWICLFSIPKTSEVIINAYRSMVKLNS